MPSILFPFRTPWMPDVADSDGDGNETELVRPRYEYEYDSRGNQTVIRDPLGRETHFAFDAFGRQISRTLPLGFGPDGQPNTADDNQAEPFTEYFFHDDYGLQVLHVSFEGVASESLFDPITGRLTGTNYYDSIDGSAIDSYQDFVNDNHTAEEFRNYEFDDHGRRDVITFSDGRIETTTFTDRGQIESIETPEGLRFYEYDQFNRLIRLSFSGSDFDNGENPENFENVVEYFYDQLGRLATVTEVERNDVPVPLNQQETRYGFDLIGNLDKTFYANGVVHDYEYNNVNQLELLTHFFDGNGNGILDGPNPSDSFDDDFMLALFDYLYEGRADGKRTGVDESFYDETGLIHSNEFRWTYDELGRLIGEAFTTGSEVDEYEDAFLHDLAGNRTQHERSIHHGLIVETTDNVYDANDRLITETKEIVDYSFGFPDTSTEVTTYGYTKTQQTSELKVVDGVPTTSKTLGFDLQGQLALVQVEDLVSNTETTTEYVNDSNGNRVQSLHTDAAGDQTRTEFLTDTQNHTGYSQVIKETKFQIAPNGQIIEIVYTIGHDQIKQTIDGETHYFGTDGHGSVRALYTADFENVEFVTDSSGKLQLYHFDAYGNLQGFAVNETPLTRYLYNSEAFDHDSQLVYLRARFYRPTNGLFIGLDSFSGNANDPQSYNKYAFVHGDPIQGIDPTGKFWASVAYGALYGGVIAGTLTGGYSFFNTLYNGGTFWDATVNGFKHGTYAAVLGALGGAAFPIAAGGLGWGAGAVGFTGATATTLEFFGASAATGAFTGAVDFWWNGLNPLEGATNGAIWGLIFAGVFKVAGNVTRGAPGRIPTTSEAHVLDDVFEEARQLAYSPGFQKAAGIHGNANAIQAFDDVFNEMRKLVATRGGAAGNLRAAGESDTFRSLALPLGGYAKPLAIIHELGHIASEAKRIVAGRSSAFDLESTLKHHDPKFWNLWLSEELSAWQTTLRYLSQPK